MPLVIYWDLPIPGCFEGFPTMESPFMQNLQSQYKVELSYRRRCQGLLRRSIVMKGADAGSLKEVLKQLIKYYRHFSPSISVIIYLNYL